MPATGDAQPSERSIRTLSPGLLAVGGILGALGASSCCVLPLVFFGLGVSGAWIGNLTALAPYQPLFVAGALGFLGAGFWRVYRRQSACDGPVCARPAPTRLVKTALWGAAALVGVAVAFPYVAPFLLS
ncbi:mercury transporter MerT [Azospirillum sp. YIM DDC1]|uniref:Mercuric transport protein MerT n=2 Tax=Azospirillum aestuarii TaxID=2802052 RepID=A0ABS1I939_9PROT|nr:mercury transporter MerT [Azospirillum aestuarii]